MLFLLASLGSAQNLPRKLAVSSVRPAELQSPEYFTGYSSLAGECGILISSIFTNQVRIERFSLCAILREAYKVQPNQIVGMPRDLKAVSQTNYFTLHFQAEGDEFLNRDDERALLRQLLAERFNLLAHWEKRKLPAFGLYLAKDRHKMSDTPLENCDAPAISMAEAPRRVRVMPICQPAMTMAKLAEQITMVFSGERQTVDRTGLTGEYAFILKWSSEENGPYPSIFTAIQEQLGLKLVAEDAEADVLVIDRLTYPNEN